MKKRNILLVGLGAAFATSFFLRKRKKPSQPERPPKKAPQLKIDNPGDQSEFPSAASESELG